MLEYDVLAERIVTDINRFEYRSADLSERSSKVSGLPRIVGEGIAITGDSGNLNSITEISQT